MSWIKCTERMPTKEERDYGEILWWNNEEACAYHGDYFHYDGTYIRVHGRHWSVELPFYEFTHWAILTPPPEEN